MPRMVWINPDFSRETEILLGELYPDADSTLIAKFGQEHAINFKTIPSSAYGSFDTVRKKKRGTTVDGVS